VGKIGNLKAMDKANNEGIFGKSITFGKNLFQAFGIREELELFETDSMKLQIATDN